MRSLRELEKQRETLESQAESGMLYMTLDDGRRIKIGSVAKNLTILQNQ